MTTRLPREDDEWPIYLDARGVAIQIGDTIVYGTRAGDVADTVEAVVTGFSDKGEVIADSIHKALGDAKVWKHSRWRGSRLIPGRVMVVTELPKSPLPTRAERIEARKRGQ